MSMPVVTSPCLAAVVSSLAVLLDSSVSSVRSTGACAEPLCSALAEPVCLGLELDPLLPWLDALRPAPTCRDTRRLSDLDLLPTAAGTAVGQKAPQSCMYVGDHSKSKVCCLIDEALAALWHLKRVSGDANDSQCSLFAMQLPEVESLRR